MSVENPPLFYTDDEHQTDPIMHTDITLRDLFAGLALIAIEMRPGAQDCNCAEIAHDAYMQATAMLAERAKRENGNG